MSFKNLGLHQSLTARCESLGFVEPTPIQHQAIPLVLNDQDIIACAETGTGKTAAFMLPILHQLIESNARGTSVLVLAPTRELTNQIEQCVIDFAPKNIRCACLIGARRVSETRGRASPRAGDHRRDAGQVDRFHGTR